VRRLVEGLPEPYRDSASRYYLDGQPQPQIAAELGVALGTIKGRVHHARRKLERAVTTMSKDWYGKCEWPEEREPTMTPEELARATLKRYDLGEFEAVGSVYEPSDSIGIGVRTTKGQYRLWRYHGYMTPEVVELEHAMLEHLVECGVPCKRLVPAGDGATWQEIDRQLVAIFEWFSGESPDLTKRQGTLAVADLHAKWTRAMEDFDPPIDGWRRLATDWRPRKSWAWVVPTEELPLVPERMGFFAAARDVEDPPPHHDRILAQLRDTEARLQRFADKVQEAGLADLPRGMNHGVFLFGSMDWELMVTDGDDCQYESRVGDLGRLIYALHDREMPPHQLRDRVTLAVDTYRQQVELSPEEVRALPLLAWGQFLFYDTFHILLYLYELDGADRGAGFVARRTDQWVRVRDEWERRFEELGEALSGR
jgi:Ser/Thr protein kinase RdoA (MazF antagonist)